MKQKQIKIYSFGRECVAEGEITSAMQYEVAVVIDQLGLMNLFFTNVIYP